MIRNKSVLRKKFKIQEQAEKAGMNYDSFIKLGFTAKQIKDLTGLKKSIENGN